MSKKVTVIVPVAFGLRVKGQKDTVQIQPGIQELDAGLANHWYVKAQGVQVYEPAKPEADKKSDKKSDDKPDPDKKSDKQK